MQIHGGINNCLQLAKSDENPPLIGPTLAIHLSQQAASAAVWTLDVDCQIDEGFFRVGTLVTRSPAAGDPASRVVGMAFVPGARGWRVTYSCPTTGEIAELFLSSSHCCGGEFGLHANSAAVNPLGDTMNVATFVVTANVPNLAAFPVAALNNDGVVAQAGDVAMLMANAAAATRGPWVLGTVNAGVAPLTRPTWWQSGATIATGSDIRVGGAGTVYKNTVWSSNAPAKSFVVDAADPVLFPRVLKGSATLLNGAVNVSGVPIGVNPAIEVHLGTFLNANFTIRYDGAVAVPGPVGTGVFQILGEKADGSQNVADESIVFWELRNDAGAP